MFWESTLDPYIELGYFATFLKLAIFFFLRMDSDSTISHCLKVQDGTYHTTYRYELK